MFSPGDGKEREMEIYESAYDLADTISEALGQPAIFVEQSEMPGAGCVIAPETWDFFGQAPDYFGVRHVIAFGPDDIGRLGDPEGQRDLEFCGAVVFYRPVI